MTAEASGGARHLAALHHVVPYHTYTVGHVLLFVSLVLSAATSLRGARRVLTLLMAFFQLPGQAPAGFTGRFWLLRVGYYKLTRPKESAEDWVWIVDHTVQIGAEKCFVILGVRLSALGTDERCLRHAEVEPIALCPVRHSNGAVVYQQLEDHSTKTGIPREILGDHGSDLKAGVGRFGQQHPETSYIYDIKHKTAGVLQQELQEDARWQEFTRLAAHTKHQGQQTAWAFLAPPNQRTKARYMNLESLLRWAHATLIFLDTQQIEPRSDMDQHLLAEKLGWLQGFRETLTVWHELLQIIEATESFVRRHGVYRGAYRALRAILTPLAQRARPKKVSHHLLALVAQQSLQAKRHERLLGSSEVSESVFGKLKRLEQDQAKGGFTGLLLSVGAMVSTTTKEVVQSALETVSTNDVLEWCKQKLGQSLQAKRKAAFAIHTKTEQKRDQFQKAG
jgi:hypothetical protein